PAVVVAGQQNVDLIASERTDFRLPYLTSVRIDGQSVAVAMAIGKDLWLCTGSSDKRVVRWHRAVVLQAKCLAHVVVERLRFHAQAVVFLPVVQAAQAIAIANGEKQHAAGAEEDAGGSVA